MTERTPQDSTRERFQQLLEKKKAANKAGGSGASGGRDGHQHLPDAKSGKSFKRRKV
jgi:hypothetical protein